MQRDELNIRGDWGAWEEREAAVVHRKRQGKDDDGESFGKSSISFAFERKMLMRRAARERRAKYLMSIRVPAIVEPIAKGIQIQEPRSDDARELGIRSYRKFVPNRLSLTSDPVNREGAWHAVSLPYVSILGVFR